MAAARRRPILAGAGTADPRGGLTHRQDQAGGTGRGRRSSPMATKVKVASVTFIVASLARSRRQTSTWMRRDERPT